MNFIRQQIPNALTCLNLFCGCVASVMVFRNHLDWAAYLVFIAAFFDLLDGMVARALHVTSPIGKELDSLADAVSFGFVPGLIVFKLLQMSNLSTIIESNSLRQILQFFPFVITVFSALRLAKFNIDTRQSTSFIGLPTPANTLLVVSFPLMLKQDLNAFGPIILNPYFLIVFSVICSFLLVSELPLFSLKFKDMSFKNNKFQYILLLISALLIPFFFFAAIPIIIGCYVLLSIIQNSTQKQTS
ncbi:MAG TPA: CDP-diacylglycerol--serine O-phosphatidyltransferase [Bacteroidia bacterium]|nr:CDP-diacylglycerol--serine O-phosphatidyltransferase [Bacteroidia bacterium]